MKTMIVLMGLLTVLGGLLPFLAERNFVPPSIPTSGPMYQGIIIIIGVLGMLYGLRQTSYNL